MTSYGGYQRTGYGAQGGDDGGGFMSGTQQGSQGERKNYADDTLRPLTIKQILDCKEPYPNSDLVVDGIPTTQVTIVGQVREIKSGTVHVTYRVDDGTGILEVKKFIDPDKPDSAPTFAADTYVRVFGNLNSYNGRKSIKAHYVRAIEDFNEVNYHLLEATYVHLSLVKAAGGTTGGQQQQQDAGGDSMFVDGGYGADTGGAQIGAGVQARLGNCSRNAKTVFSCLANSPGDGVHLNQVAASTSLPVRDIMAAAEELLSNGMIYTTDDDETWAILDY